MKKHLAILLIVSCLGTLSWAQGTKSELFDTKKSQDELNVMKAALSATLSNAAQNLERQAAAVAAQAPASTTGQIQTPFGPAPLFASGIGGAQLTSTWGYANINAFYLYGQGAVFVVPASTLRLSRYASTAAGTGYGIGGGFGQGIVGGVPGGVVRGVPGGVVGGVPGGVVGGTVGGVQAGVPAAPPQPAAVPKPVAPPAPPAPPSPPTNTSTNPDELRKVLDAQIKAYEEQILKYQESMQKFQEEMQKAQEAMRKTYIAELEKYNAMSAAQLQQQTEKQSKDLEARRAQTIAALGEIKKNLIEALANYGDALTTVKPNEYISIVILLDAPEGPTVISAQRSWITDYKAGRLTLDAFKQKVLQYSE